MNHKALFMKLAFLPSGDRSVCEYASGAYSGVYYIYIYERRTLDNVVGCGQIRGLGVSGQVGMNSKTHLLPMQDDVQAVHEISSSAIKNRA